MSQTETRRIERESRRDKWAAFVYGWIFGFGTLGTIAAVELTGWLFLAYISMAAALLLFGFLLIDWAGLSDTRRRET